MMSKRLLTIGGVFLVALLLMWLQNKVLVGSQELFADVSSPEAGLVEVRFTDLAGNQVNATDHEKAVVESRLKGDPEAGRPAFAFAEGSLVVTPSKRIRFRPDQGVALEALRDRLGGDTYRRPNPARSLFHITTGIDLRGGVEFNTRLYDDDGNAVSADEETVAILRKRLDARGLTEPNVTRLSNGDVQVTIPGGTEADAARTRKVLQTTGRLEFREVLEVSGGAGDNGYLGPDQVSDLGNGRWGPGEGVFLDPFDGEVIYPMKPPRRGDRPTRFLRLGKVALTGYDVEDAYRTIQDGQVAVGITFTAAGGAKNQAFTADVKARGDVKAGSGRIAISLDGVVESDPTIINPSGRHTVITGRFSDEEVESLRTVLKAGALTVTPVVLAEKVVGPSLGRETVAKAGWSMFAALLLVMATLVVYYRRLGIVALISLVTCIALIYAVLIVFSATLTLPGIAGLVLTVGMAVDANILIFERIREEMRGDIDVASAIDAGFSRAFMTIVDANLTTFITALILYWQGSGPVQGFGLTLMVGIATSMFAAIYVGRTITDMLYRRAATCVVPDYIGLVRLPYVRWRFAAFVVSAILIVAGTLEFFVLSPANKHFDIDFTGGNAVQVTFTEPIDLERIDQGLANLAAEHPDLAPGEVQKQPYFAAFGEGANASRQWVLKARDQTGTGIEAERTQLEAEMREYRKARDAARNQRVVDEAAAAIAEAELAKRQPELDRLNQAIAERVDAFAELLRTEAFPGLIAAPGAEIRAAAWDGATLSLKLELLAAPGVAATQRLAESLAADDAIISATAEATGQAPGEAGLAVSLTYASAPEGVVDSDDRIEPEQARLADLLGADPRSPTVTQAFSAYQMVVDRAARQNLRVALPFPSTQHFSGSVAAQMKISAVIALALALVAILAYVAARFEFKYGLGAVIALFHDVPITLGLLALLGVRIDLTVVAALLTIIGYSLNDTIVVFDRIREVLRKGGMGLAEAIDQAIAQTMSRTIMTSATTLGVVLILLLFGGEGVRSFAITLTIGLILGTYSSIFIAAPVLLSLDRSGSLEELAAAAREQEAEGRADQERTPDQAAIEGPKPSEG